MGLLPSLEKKVSASVPCKCMYKRLMHFSFPHRRCITVQWYFVQARAECLDRSLFVRKQGMSSYASTSIKIDTDNFSLAGTLLSRYKSCHSSSSKGCTEAMSIRALAREESS